MVGDPFDAVGQQQVRPNLGAGSCESEGHSARRMRQLLGNLLDAVGQQRVRVWVPALVKVKVSEPRCKALISRHLAPPSS